MEIQVLEAIQIVTGEMHFINNYLDKESLL
jgi:hypothetical protein